MKIDSHQHFWYYNPEEYRWVDEGMEALRKDYTPEDLAPLLSSIGFDGVIAVQARTTLEETEWLVSLARKYDIIKGVVGWVDLRAPDVEKVLDRFPDGSPLKGVRYKSDKIDDQLDRGIAALSRRGLTYDLLMHPPDIPAAIGLVTRYPEQRFVVDHIGRPVIRDRNMLPWRDDIRRLAKKGNVWCKLSGMVFEASWRRWKPGDFTPYIDVIYDAFGPDRLMIGSNWPVCLVAGDYKPVMEIVIDYTRNLSSHAAEKILGDTCSRFYGVRGRDS